MPREVVLTGNSSQRWHFEEILRKKTVFASHKTVTNQLLLVTGSVTQVILYNSNLDEMVLVYTRVASIVNDYRQKLPL